MPASEELTRRIYNAFSLDPLTPEQHALYVELDQARGSVGIVSRLAAKIRLANAPTCHVLTGHRGSGKSTELFRLKHELERSDAAQEPSFFVVSCSTDEDVDPNDVDFPEVLIALVRQLAAQVKAGLAVDLAPGYLRERLAQMRELLSSQIRFEEFELGAGLLKLSGAIKDSPEARRRVREALDPDTNNWLAAANEVIRAADAAAKRQGHAGLVVIVDGLDKIAFRTHPSGAHSVAEYLYVQRAAQMTAFACHVVYSMPIELAYSHHQATIRNLYGGYVPVVPMTKLRSQPPSRKRHEEGMRRFGDVIRARLKSVRAQEGDLFSDEAVRDQLIELSGGQPVELMHLVREAIVTGGLPVQRTALDRVRNELERDYTRQMRVEYEPLLQEVDRTGKVTRTQENERPFRELLASRMMLLYMNDDEWYDLNPGVAPLVRPATPPARTPRRRRKRR